MRLPNLAAHLLNDSPDVRKPVLVLCSRPEVSADHVVKFFMCASLNFWM